MSFGDYIGRDLDHELSEDESHSPLGRGDPHSAREAASAVNSGGQDAEAEVDLSGTWIVDRARSYPIHDLLKAMGVSWVSRKMYPSETTLRIQQCPVLQVNETGTAFNHHTEIPLDGKPHDSRDPLGDNVTVTAYLDQETQAVIVETEYPRRLGGCRTVDIRQLLRDGVEMRQEIQLWASGQLVHACRRTWSKLQENKPTTYDGLLAGIGRMQLQSTQVKAALAEGANSEVLCSVYENQRFYPSSGSGGGGSGVSSSGHGKWKSELLSSDGVSRWSDEWDQPSESRDQINATLPQSWHWLGPWRVDQGQAEAVTGAHSQKVITDSEGWSYRKEFPVHGAQRRGPADWQGRFVPGETFVRRRRWVRSRAPDSSDPESDAVDGLRSLESPTAESGISSGGSPGDHETFSGSGKNGVGSSGKLSGELLEDPDSGTGDGDSAGSFTTGGGTGNEDGETEGIAAYMLRQERAKTMKAAQEQAARMNAAIAGGGAGSGGAAGGGPGGAGTLEPTQRELALEAENTRLANEGQQFLVQLIQQKQTNQEIRQQLLKLMAGERDEDLEDLEDSQSQQQQQQQGKLEEEERKSPGSPEDGPEEESRTAADGEDGLEEELQAPSPRSRPAPHGTSKAALREQLARLREQVETEHAQLRRQLRKRKLAQRKLKKHASLLEENCRMYEEKLAEYDRDYMEMTRRLGDSSISHNKIVQDAGSLRDENIRLSRIAEDLRLEGQALREHQDKMLELVQTLTEDKRAIVRKHLQEIDALKLSLRQQISERTNHMHLAMKEARRQQGLAQDDLMALRTRTDLQITELEENARENLQAISAELQRAHQIAAQQIESEKGKREEAEADLENLQLELYAETQKAQRLQKAILEARRERDEALRQSETLTDLLGKGGLSEPGVLELELSDLRHSLAESGREKAALEAALREAEESRARAAQGGAAAELEHLRAEKLRSEQQLRAELGELRRQLQDSRARAEEAEESEAAMAAALGEAAKK